MVTILEEDKFSLPHEWPPKLSGLKGASRPPLNMRAANALMQIERLFSNAEVSGKSLAALIDEEWAKYGEVMEVG